MSKYLDTRDLAKRKSELEDLRDAVTTCEDELKAAKEALTAFDPERPDVASDDEAWYEKKDELEEAVTDAESNLEAAQADFTDDEKTELDELDELENEISEWRHGETMVPESEFTDYIMEMLEDCGTLPRDLPWYISIDRDQTAENCKADYTEVEYQGTTYLVRA